MSDDASQQLALRRQRLQLRSAAQRQQLRSLLADIDSRVAALDQGLARVRVVLGHPAVLAGGALLVFALGPRRMLRMAGKAMLAFSAVRRLLGLLR